MRRDPYKLLGIKPGASEKEIKAAYRKKAKQFHPDLNPSPKAEAIFKQINEAYQYLMIPSNRRSHSWSASADTRYRGPSRNEAYSSMFSEDFWEAVFNTRSNSEWADPQWTQPVRGEDIYVDVSVSLQEAYHGTYRNVKCYNSQVSVRIPPGVHNKTKLRVEGKGKPGKNGGYSGNLYVNVSVDLDPRFRREGCHLYTEVDVDLYTAVLGGVFKVYHLGKDLNIRIPAGAQPYQVVRLPGKGMPVYNSRNQRMGHVEFGDLFITLNIIIPTALSIEEIDMFKNLRDYQKE